MTRVTLQTIAQHANVSIMTVSLALRSSPRISAATRERVVAEAKRLGYQPDPALSALVAYRRKVQVKRDISVLAFITNWREEFEWKEHYVRELFDGAERQALARGYKLEPFWLRACRNHCHAGEVLHNRGIRGLLIAPLPKGCGHLRLPWHYFSAVSLGMSMARPLLHRAAHDYFGSTRLALHHLRRLGYRRVALALPKRVNALADHRIPAAVLEEHRQNRALLEPIFWIGEKEDRESFLHWFQKRRPEVILSLQQHYLNWLKEDGWAAPRDFGFANLHIPAAQPQTSGIIYGAEKIGEAALDMLDTLIQKNETGIPLWPLHISVPGTWRPGQTLAARA
jgi:LacI family transcriptional regulator